MVITVLRAEPVWILSWCAPHAVVAIGAVKSADIVDGKIVTVFTLITERANTVHAGLLIRIVAEIAHAWIHDALVTAIVTSQGHTRAIMSCAINTDEAAFHAENGAVLALVTRVTSALTFFVLVCTLLALNLLREASESEVTS